MVIKILGLAGSPLSREKSTSAFLCREALQAAEEVKGVETEIIYLSEKKIEPCRACDDLGTGGLNCGRVKRCVINDDMTNEIYDKLKEADGILVSTPVYFGSVTAQLKALMDRTCWLKMREFWALRDKVGAAIAVAHGRHGGQEATVMVAENWMRISGMIIVSFGAPTRKEMEGFHKAYDGDPYFKAFKPDLDPYLGASAHFPGGWAAVRPGLDWIKRDWVGITYARRLGTRVATIAKWVKPHLQSREEIESDREWHHSRQKDRIRL